MSTEAPERIKYQREHYACTNPLCLAEHDGEYISLAAHEKAIAEARRETWERAIQELYKVADVGNGWPGRTTVIAVLEAAAKEERDALRGL
jgi:hypothetical protein